MKSEEGPDKGWSWVIAFACFFISLILFGIYRTSGILLVAFVNEYEVSREDSSWPLFLCFSVVDLTGLIVGPLGQKFGVRPVTIIGSLISALGVSLCYFAHSLDFITVSFGVIFGFGFGLTYTLMPVITNEYFLNHRATANGIANSGGCFGSVVFPPLYEHLMSTYGLNGCLLLTGGIILQLAISGALMKPPSWLKKGKSEAVEHKLSENGQISENLESNLIEASDNLSNSLINKSSTMNSINLDVMVVTETPNQSVSDKEIKYLCDKNLTQGNLKSEIINILNNPLCFDRNSKELATNGDQIELSTKGYCKQNNGNSFKSLSIQLNHEAFIDANYTTVNNVDERTVNEIPEELQKEVLISDVKSLQHLNVNEEETTECSESDRLIQANQTVDISHDASFVVKDKDIQIIKHRNNALSSEKMYGDEGANCEVPLMQSKAENCDQLEILNTDSKDKIKSSMQKTDKDGNLSILESFKRVLTCPMFYVIALSNVFFFSNEEMFFVINADFYIDKGVADTDVKYIIIAFSSCDLIGRLCFGWVTDRKFLKRSHFMMLCMVAVAIIYFSFPFANGYMSLMVLNSLYGLILGCTTIVFTVLPVDYLHMDIQAIAFGCIGFLCGLLTLMCSLLIGYFRDNLGSYSNIFYLMGAISVATSFLWLLEKCFTKADNPPSNSELA